MAIYNSAQSIFNEALGDFRHYGFELCELNDHLLELYFHGIKIASYNQSAATIPVIQEGCHNYLVNRLRQLNERGLL
jgi:hypothetical protein